MIQNSQAIDVFKLQSELLDAKVDMAADRAIDRVIDQINALRNDMHTQIHQLKDDMNLLRSEMHTKIHDLKEDMNTQIHGIREDMHELRHEMRDRFVSLETRVTAVETKLGMVSEPRKEIRNRFIDYCFKAGWLILAATVSYTMLPLHGMS